MIAIRGAVQIDRDTKDAIGAGVRELCRVLSRENALAPDEIVSAFFTLTPDLRAEFPAKIARDEGWGDVPMICAQELGVPNGMPRVCRVMLHVDRDRRTSKAKHVYLRGARALRPDLAGAP
jgi:chorismate mutase